MTDCEIPEICIKCGGRCCKHQPGSYYPEDFGAPDLGMMESRLRRALATGRYAIDYWRQAKNYVVRPAKRGREGKRFDLSEGPGRCTFLTFWGCELKLLDRPAKCRAVGPLPDFKCIDPPTDRQIWSPYQELLRNLRSLIMEEAKSKRQKAKETKVNASEKYLREKLRVFIVMNHLALRSLAAMELGNAVAIGYLSVARDATKEIQELLQGAGLIPEQIELKNLPLEDDKIRGAVMDLLKLYRKIPINSQYDEGQGD